MIHSTIARIASALAVGAVVIGASLPAMARVTKIRPPRTFPYVISQPGAYILDENLVVPDENTTAIEVQVGNVTIDLNGFTIRGPVVCTTPTACAPTPTNFGIIATGHDNVRVMNGTVRGMLDAIRLTGAMHRVEGITAVSNAGIGIYIGSGIVADCIAAFNGDQGIYASGNYSRIRDCIAIDNGLQGVDIGRTILTGSIAVNNLREGIRDQSGGYSQISGNVANDNDDAGIYTDNALMLGNVAVDNGGIGLDAVNSAYGFNYLTGNNSGGTQGPFSSVEVGVNACGGDTTCP